MQKLGQALPPLTREKSRVQECPETSQSQMSDAEIDFRAWLIELVKGAYENVGAYDRTFAIKGDDDDGGNTTAEINLVKWCDAIIKAAQRHSPKFSRREIDDAFTEYSISADAIKRKPPNPAIIISLIMKSRRERPDYVSPSVLFIAERIKKGDPCHSTHSETESQIAEAVVRGLISRDEVKATGRIIPSYFESHLIPQAIEVVPEQFRTIGLEHHEQKQIASN